MKAIWNNLKSSLKVFRYFFTTFPKVIKKYYINTQKVFLKLLISIY